MELELSFFQRVASEHIFSLFFITGFLSDSTRVFLRSTFAFLLLSKGLSTMLFVRHTHTHINTACHQLPVATANPLGPCPPNTELGVSRVLIFASWSHGLSQSLDTICRQASASQRHEDKNEAAQRRARGTRTTGAGECSSCCTYRPVDARPRTACPTTCPRATGDVRRLRARRRPAVLDL